jgi:hypothetical protein
MKLNNRSGTFTVSIDNGASSSGEFYVSDPDNTARQEAERLGFRGFSIRLAGNWTAADIVPMTSGDNGATWQPLRDQYGTVVRFAGLANNFHSYLDGGAGWALGAATRIRLDSVQVGTLTPQAQGQACTITVRPLR